MLYFFEKFEKERDMVELIRKEIDFVLTSRKDIFSKNFGSETFNSYSENDTFKDLKIIENEIKETIENHEKRIYIIFLKLKESGDIFCKFKIKGKEEIFDFTGEKK